MVLVPASQVDRPGVGFRAGYGGAALRDITAGKFRRCGVGAGLAEHRVRFWCVVLSDSPALAAASLTGIGLVWVFVPAMEVLPFDFADITARQVSTLAALVLTFSAIGFGAGPVVAGAIAQATGSLPTGALAVAGMTGLAILAAATAVPERPFPPGVVGGGRRLAFSAMLGSRSIGGPCQQDDAILLSVRRCGACATVIVGGRHLGLNRPGSCSCPTSAANPIVPNPR